MRHPITRRLGLTALVSLTLTLTLTLGVSVEVSAQNIEALAGDLARLRMDVEGVGDELREIQTDRTVRERSLATQKTELEIELRRARLQRAQLEEAVAKKKEANASRDAQAQALVPVVRRAISKVRGCVASGLPFKLEERLGAFDELTRKLDSGELGAHKVLTRLWSLVEDERKLGRENGLYQQIIDIEGTARLTDVARLGLAMMFARLEGGHFARAAYHKKKGWTWVRVQDSDDAARVALLFDALKKQIRAGYFELPYALPPRVEP